MTNKPENKKAEAIFTSALEIDSAGERSAYLDVACGGDAALRTEVEELLRHDSDAGSFLGKPPQELEATIGSDVLGAEPDETWRNLLSPSDVPGCIGMLGPYEIIELVGRGGMGVVFRARDPKLNRVVAVKLLAPELAANVTAARRFLREAQAAAAVSHDHVVTIHAIDQQANPPVIVMEFVDGQSLQEKIDREGVLDLKSILRIAMQVVAGLAAAHRQGIVHRDIKPSNILLENSIERVKLTDFGLARAVDDISVTRTGQVTGTPQYMSPEQAMGRQIDHRTDLFSLGCVIYAMCTGRAAFRADSTVAVMHRVVHDTPRPVREINEDIPEWMCEIVEKLLEKNPANRFESASEVEELLGGNLAHIQQPNPHGQPARDVNTDAKADSQSEIKAHNSPSSDKKTSSEDQAENRIARVSTIAWVVVLACCLVGAKVFWNMWLDRNQGTVIVESENHNVILNFHQITRESSGGNTYDLKFTMPGTLYSGDGSIRLPSGRYYATLSTQANDFELSQDRFTLGRGEEIRIQVRRKKSASVATPPRTPLPDGPPGIVTTLEGHADGIADLVFSSDGRFVYSASSDKRVHVWNIATGQDDGQLPNVRTRIECLAVSRNARCIVGGGADFRLVVWDGASGRVLRRMAGHESVVYGVDVSPDGRHVLSCSNDGTVRQWDLQTGDHAILFKEPDSSRFIRSVVHSLDGENLVYAGNIVRLGSLRTGKSFLLEGPTHLGGICAGFSLDGRLVIIGYREGAIGVFNVATGELIPGFGEHNDTVTSLAVTPDGGHFITGSLDKTIRVWNLESRQEVHRYEVEDRVCIHLAVSPDGRFIVSSGGGSWIEEGKQVSNGDRTLRIWRLPPLGLGSK